MRGIGLSEPDSKGLRGFSHGDVVAGRYSVDNRLGQGGMASVWRVRDIELDETIALKILDERLVGDDQAIAQFKQEIKLARRIVHRNVCRIFDFGIAGDLRFVTMELVEGKSLAEAMAVKGLLGFESKLEIFRDVLLGLRAAHNLGIVHRDIKPGNVMVTPDGHGILMDFGIASPAGGLGLEGAATIVGTPAYLAPERILIDPDADHRSDLYSLGILLFEIMAGRLPFEERNVRTLLQLHLSTPAPMLGDFWPECPEELGTIVARLLRKTPSDRFGSTDDLLDALADVHFDDSGCRVLIGDPDPAFRKGIRMKLAGENIRVVEASTGEEAIEGILRTKPDLVCLDLGLPILDGFQVVEWFRRYRASSQAPVFLFSSTNDARYGAYAARLGIEKYFPKPVSFKETAAAIVGRLSDSGAAHV